MSVFNTKFFNNVKKAFEQGKKFKYLKIEIHQDMSHWSKNQDIFEISTNNEKDIKKDQDNKTIFILANQDNKFNPDQEKEKDQKLPKIWKGESQKELKALLEYTKEEKIDFPKNNKIVDIFLEARNKHQNFENGFFDQESSPILDTLKDLQWLKKELESVLNHKHQYNEKNLCHCGKDGNV